MRPGADGTLWSAGAPFGRGELGALLLAGGRASRMDGVRKPLLDVGGITLLERAVRSARSAGSAPLTVVSECLDPELDVHWVREQPPLGGPAAAIVAGLESWSRRTPPPWTLVLACDLARADVAVARLLNAYAARRPGRDGICLTDARGRPQWLAGIYRSSVLQRNAARLPDRGRDASVRALVASAGVSFAPATDDDVLDVDTWVDLARARRQTGVHPSVDPEGPT